MTAKRRRFVECYIAARCNGAEAARRAGYSERCAKQEARRLLQDPEVRAAISERVAEAGMSAEEVLLRLSEQARGELTAFIRVGEDRRSFVDVEAVLKAGKGHLIRSLRSTAGGDTVVEWPDAHSALVQLGRYHGLWRDRIDHTTGGAPFKVYVGVDPSEV